MTARDSTHNVKSSAGSAERMPARLRPTWRGLVLRGGRATKYKGVAGGVSPQSVNFISMVVGAATAVVGSHRSLLLATSAVPMIEDCSRPASERRAGRDPKGKGAARPLLAVLPRLLVASLALGSSAQAQTVTVSGSTGQWSTGCTSVAVVPGSCFTMTTLTNPNAPTWTFKPALTSGVAIGTNGSNSNSGSMASGEVSITGGGTAETDEIYLGFEANTTGSALISGPGSTWTADATAIIGHYGTGSLQILDGGLFNSASSNYFYAGYEPSGVGTVTVSGVDATTGDRSTLTAANRIYIGNNGTGTLSILGGGYVSSAFTMFIGETGSGLVEVSGVDAATQDQSTLQVLQNQLWVGDFGQGKLHVLDGGLVKVDQGVGFGSDVTGQGYGTVDGVDPTTGIRSEIDATYVYVGLSDQGKLRITNGGLVSASSSVQIGDNPGAVGVLRVDGVDAASGTPSTLTTNSLYVGYDGTGTLNIVNGGLVSNTTSYLGIISLNTTSPGTANVSGNDGHGHASTWTMTGNLKVGDNSIGSAIGIGTLNVSDGGVVSDAVGYIGFGANSQGTVTVSGVDSNGHASTWTNTSDLVIGQDGTGVLNIEAGGQVTNNTGWIGADPGSSGTVTVSGNDGAGHASTWTNTGDLHIGDTGAAGNPGVGTLTIADGGAVSNGTAYLGNNTGAQGTVTVSGVDSSGHASTWTNTGDVVVGQHGTGTLDIEGGGQVTNQFGYVGASAGSNGTVTVSGRDSNGNPSTWTSADELLVGADHGMGALTITDGGLVSVAAASIGDEPGGQGGVTVSGTDSSGHASAWTNTGTLFVGNSGTGSLTVQGGGQVNSDQASIGSSSGGSGTVKVTGIDSAGHASAWTALDNIYVGLAGTGMLTVADGGAVSTIGGGGGLAIVYLGYDSGATGTATVSSATNNVSTLTASDTVIIGEGGTGTLTIDKGGLVSAALGVVVADQTTATGTLNLLGDTTGRGVLETSSVIKGDGAAILNLDGGILRATRDQSDFLSGFDALTVGSKGAWFDTNAHDIAVATAFTGSSSFNKIGQGTLTLTGDSSAFTGTTTISAGTLQLGDGGTSGGIGGNVVDNGALTFDRLDPFSFTGAISGSGGVNQIGAGALTLASNSYTGGTFIGAGSAVVAGSNTAFGSGLVTMAAGSSISFSGPGIPSLANRFALIGDPTYSINMGQQVILSGAITDADASNPGVLEKTGLGRLILTADNTYSGGTTISAGTIQLGNGVATTGSIIGNITDNGVLTFERPDNIVFSGVISGSGGVVKAGAGMLTLTGDNTYHGSVTLQAGELRIDGNQSLATGAVGVPSGTTFSGSGFFGGEVDVANGGILNPGDDGPGTLTIGSRLTLLSTSVLNFQLGQANVVGGTFNDFVSVGADLRLDGTINVTVPTGGSFAGGIYRIFNYGGTLTDNGLTLGTMPAGSDVFVLTSIAKQVDLVNTAGLDLTFWDGDAGPHFDGAINGGNGFWHLGGTDYNWTETTGKVNAPYQNASFPIFAGAPGTVTIDNTSGAVTASGLQFATDGYVITGDALTLTGPTTEIRVGDGSAMGAGYTATIASVLTGASAVELTDLGTLILTSANTYSGGTVIDAGALQLGNGGATGGITGDVNDNGALAFDRSDNGLVLSGVISGSGAVSQIGSGKTTLTGDDTYTGGTTITAGTLQLGNGSTTGSIVGNVADNGVLAFDRLDNVAFDGVISGTGAVTKAGADTVTLTGNNTYTGVTTIAAGTLQLGNGGATGSIVGNVTSGGVLAFNRSDDGLVLGGAISGGAVQQIGSGTTTLTGTSSYTSTTVTNGALRIEGAVTNTSGIAVTGNNASLIISGPGASFTTTGNTVNPVLGSATGITFTVEDGGHYRNNLGFAFFAQTAGTIATLNVTGAGSSFFTDTSIGVKDGIGFFNVTDGGQITNNSDLFLGTNNFASANGQATIVISGAGSSWKATNIAYMANATVSLLDGGLLAIGTADIGTFAGKTTNVLVSGQDSQLDVGSLNFGTAATAQAAITVADQGALVLTGGARALSIGASGTLNIGGAVGEAATGAGTIDAASVTLTGALNFNHDDSAYLFGLAISGNGRVTQAGSGTTILTANNTYTGGTTITAGALQLGDGGMTGSLTGGVTDNGALAFDRSDVVTFAGLISGSGAVSQIGAGTTILTTDETYTGDTTIAAGTLQLGNGGTSGSIVGDVADNGVLAFDRLDDVAFDSVISGSGAVSQIGAGTTIFTTDETYTGGTTIAAGTLQLGNGGTTGAILGNVADNGMLAFDRSDTVAFGGMISGSGGIHQAGPGATVLSGANSYTGQTTIDAGILRINGDQSAATGLTRVNSGGTLGGSGIIGGSVQVADGGALAPGNSPGTLTIKGDLTLASGAALDYQLGQAGVAGGVLNDLVNVGGDLTLDGTLNVTPSAGGAFGAGLYRIFNYDGTLTNNGLDLGSVPAGTDLSVQTSVANQVNLVNSTGLRLNFWDGQAGGKNDSLIQGGDGVWRLADGVNSWTTMTGSLNADYAQNSFAIFTGAAGTVTIDNGGGAVSASGLQFAVDGYRLQGDALTLTGASAKIRVGDGAADGAAMTATIAADLIGTAQLTKTDLGTLVLTGTNSYAGGTAIQAGALQLGDGGSTGSILGDVANDGVLTFDRSDTVTFGGAISGSGAVRQIGGGTVILTGDNTYTGTTTITAGTLQLGDGGTSGSLTGDIVNNSALAFDRLGTATYGGAISGVGSVTQIGSGTTLLTGDSTYTGMTEIDAGELRVAGGGQVSGTTFVSVDTGALTVTGAGSAFTTPGDLVVGRGAGAASVMVSDGGQLNTGRSFIGELGVTTTSATALTATVTGAGSVWTATDGFFLGDQSGSAPVSLTVADGGLMHVQQFSSIIGNGGTALVTVTDANSRLVLDDGVNLLIGQLAGGAGTLTITNGGIVTAPVVIMGVSDVNASGVLNINGVPGAQGVLETTSLTKDVGSGTVNFNGGVLRASDDNGTDFIAGFNPGDITIGTGGAFIDSNGFSVTASSALAGAGALTKQGAGTLVLTAENTYAGGTIIQAGTLQLGDGGTGGSITGNVTDNGVLAFDRLDDVTFTGAISGAGAVSQIGAGATILTSANTYAGGTTITAGTLQLGNGGMSGSLTGDVVDNAALAFDRLDTVTFGGVISGSGAVSQIGGGTTILTGDNTYAGPTTIQAGTLQLGNSGMGGSIVGDVADNAALAFDRLDDVTFGGVISGSGAVSQIGGGATVLTGANSYAGTTTISLGSLFINGDQSAAAGLTQVLAGGVLGGTGVIGGDVMVADNAALNPGDNSSAPGTLTIKGGLSLSGASVLNYSFGQANTVGGPLNDLIKVGGDLTLGGVINVVSSPGGAFDPGLYRVISYDGTLTDDGLTIGSAPSATFDVQTAIAHQVNLVNTAGLNLNYWDGGAGLKNNGAIEGGDGVWHVGGSDSNWTTETGDLNASYANGAFAIFAAAPGVVSIDGAAGDVHTSGMQFAVDGYQLGGDPLFLDGAATIRVGDGTADGAGYVAAIASQLSGSGGLVKTDLGTLVLTGANTYAGATSVNTGRLEINGDQSGAVGLTTVNAQGTLAGSGVVGGNVTVVDGTIAPGTSAAPGGLTIKGNLTLNAGSSLDYRLGQAGMVGGALNDLLTVGGDLTLDGTLNVTTSAGGTFGPGIYRLIDYSGTLTDNGLALGALPTGNSGSIQTSVAGQVNLVDAVGATMVNFWDGPKGTSNDDVITGGDGVWRVGGADLWAVANGSANGAFQSGVYAVFSGAAGTVTVDNSAGPVSVSGMQFATDGYKVTGGAISLDAGDAIVRVGDGTSAGAAFKAAISAELTGPGQLDKTDLGTLILTGANTYTGGTKVSSGTLQLGDGGTSGSIQGDVAVAGALAFNRSDATTFGGVISGSGTLAQTGSGATILTADSSAFTGQTAVRAGTLEVDGVLGGTADVASGGQLAGTGQVGATTNHGVIAPGRNGLGTLTIAGNYAGQGGGLAIQAQLGGDASPTDRLVVTGATSGATPVTVTNLGGQGGLTQKGIEIVQVSGASSGQFTLANGAYSLGGQAVVVAGAYGYVLQKNPNDGGWYLRSSLPGGNGGEAPLYQPGAPVYEAYANTLLSLSEAPTLRQRVGERQYDTTDTDHDGVWGRVEGTTSRLEPGISTTDVHQDIGSWKAQFGIDRTMSGSPDGSRLVAGLTAQVGTASTRTTSPYGGGDINTTASGLGATLTWYGQQGAYVDAQAQATWFASDLNSNLVRTLAEGEHGHGYGLSVETGKAFAVRGDLSITPQAQLSYTSAGFDDFNDRFGADIDSDKGESLQGRLGLAFDHNHSWQDATGQLRQLNVYSLVNLKYEFLDGTRVLVSGTPLDSRQGRTWAGLGGGGTYSWGNGRYSVYGQATADTTLAGFGDSFTVTATTGFRMRF